MSILSREPDGMNCYYGHLGNRRIDVMPVVLKRGPAFIAFVSGDEIGDFDTKAEAEAAAIQWSKEHPE